MICIVCSIHQPYREIIHYGLKQTYCRCSCVSTVSQTKTHTHTHTDTNTYTHTHTQTHTHTHTHKHKHTHTHVRLSLESWKRLFPTILRPQRQGCQRQCNKQRIFSLSISLAVFLYFATAVWNVALQILFGNNRFDKLCYKLNPFGAMEKSLWVLHVYNFKRIRRVTIATLSWIKRVGISRVFVVLVYVKDFNIDFMTPEEHCKWYRYHFIFSCHFYLESITIQIGYIYRNVYLLCRFCIYFSIWSLQKSILHIY